jgi:hypothetical protein
MGAQALPSHVLDEVVNALDKDDLYSRGGQEKLNPQTGVPTVREELERKSLEELQRLVLALQHGKLSQAQFNEALQTLWMTTAGLVKNDISALIAKTRNELEKRREKVTRAFASKDGETFVVVSWIPSEGELAVTRHADGKVVTVPWTAPADSTIPTLDARNHFQNICESLSGTGFTQL